MTTSPPGSRPRPAPKTSPDAATRPSVALAVYADAGGGAGLRVAGTVAQSLRQRAGSLELLVGRLPDILPEVLVVLGGDGAVHDAVQRCAGTGTALGVLPAGTGNDFARGLGLPATPGEALSVVLSAFDAGRTRRIDLGRAGATWFASVLCTGFDAAVAHRVVSLRWPRGPRRYDLALLAELPRFRPHPVVLTTEDERLELEATLVAIGNTCCYGGGIPICPEARADDGLLDITVIGPASRRDLALMLPRLRTGAHVTHPAVRSLRAREIRLSAPGQPVCADGEPLPALPPVVRCEPGALRLLG